MTSLERAVQAHGSENVAAARQLARQCPTGYFVVHDLQTGQTYYRHAYSTTEIPTRFTEDLVHIAHRDLMPFDPDRLHWDWVNSRKAGLRFQVYTVSGK